MVTEPDRKGICLVGVPFCERLDGCLIPPYVAAAFLALTAACFHRAASVRGSLRAGACFLNPPF